MREFSRVGDVSERVAPGWSLGEFVEFGGELGMAVEVSNVQTAPGVYISC